MTSSNVETHYTVEIACRGAEEAHMLFCCCCMHCPRPGSGRRRIESEDIPDTSKVTVTAQAVAAKRNEAALERSSHLLSLSPYASAATGTSTGRFRRLSEGEGLQWRVMVFRTARPRALMGGARSKRTRRRRAA